MRMYRDPFEIVRLCKTLSAADATISFDQYGMVVDDLLCTCTVEAVLGIRGSAEAEDLSEVA